jgi:hypothetical protein
LVAGVVDRTLAFFRSHPKDPDLALILGEYPSQEWMPTGTLVGDRFLYDQKSGTTTVLRNRATTRPERSEVEYIVLGDLRASGEPVTVYVPRLSTPMSPSRSLGHELKNGHLRRAMLAAAGNPFGMQRVVRQAERVTEAIIEPFLFYRLPVKGLSLIQAVSVSTQGSATLVTGSANIGKTTLALHFVKKKMGFLGDNLAVLGEGGEVLPYPGLVKLQPRHLTVFPELTTRLTAGMGPIGAYLLRRELAASPDALGLLPQQEMTELFENVTIPSRSEAGNVVLVKRCSHPETTCEEVDPESLADILGVELYWGIEAAAWRSGQFVYSPSAVTGRDFFKEAAAQHAKVGQILIKGISKAKCFKVTLPLDAPVQRIEYLLSDILGLKKG